MYFNPRIEAWLYKVTKTTSPEYKSELHATNGKKNGYSQLATDDTADSESKGGDENGEEKNDAEKETPDKENEDQGLIKQEEGTTEDHKGFSGKHFACHAKIEQMRTNELKTVISLLARTLQPRSQGFSESPGNEVDNPLGGIGRGYKQCNPIKKKHTYKLYI